MFLKPLTLVTCIGVLLSLGCDSPSSTGTGSFAVAESPASTSEPLAEPLLDPFQSPGLSTDESSAYTGLDESHVDCELTLPCRWISDDRGLGVTLGAVDNIAAQQRLKVDFQVDTRYDTDISMPRSLDAIGSEGTRYRVVRQRLAKGNALTPVAVLAGEPANGWLTYNAGATDESLAVLVMPLIDNATNRNAAFVNVPVGPAPSEVADCENTLPCTWSLDSGDVSVTLQSVGAESNGGRVMVNFVVETTEDRQVVLDAGSLYVGTDGVGVEAISHRLGQTADYQAVVHPSFAGVPLAASLSFRRTARSTSTLARLMIALYENTPTPRWIPAFRRVPVQ